MKVVSPINISDSVVVNYDVTTSADANIPEYDLLKADYALNDEVKVTADKKKYKLAIATVAAGVLPKDNADIWYSSPLNEFAMFFYDNEYATESAGSIEFTVHDANIIDTVFFQDIDGDTITLELLDANGAVFDTLQEDIYDWEIQSFEQYLFPSDPVLKRKIQFDFIELNLQSIRVTISGTTTKCRYCVVGYKDDVGMTLRDGIGYNQNNFFATQRDSWGNLESTKIRVIEDVSLPVLDYNTHASININKISRLFAEVNLWIADDRDKENVEHDFINIFGVLISNNVVPGQMITQKTLKIEGK